MVGTSARRGSRLRSVCSEHADKAFLLPGNIGLPAEKSRHQGRPAMHFAALDRQIDLRAAGITADNGVFRAQHFIEQARDVKSGRAGAGTAAARRLLGLADIVDASIGRVGAHVVNDVVLFRRADPGDLGEIEFDFRPADQLIEINRRQDGAEGETVRFGDVVEIIGRDDRRGARHVLHEDRRIARNVLAVVAGQDPRPQIVAATGGRTDDDPDRLALVERASGPTPVQGSRGSRAQGSEKRRVREP